MSSFSTVPVEKFSVNIFQTDSKSAASNFTGSLAVSILFENVFNRIRIRTSANFEAKRAKRAKKLRTSFVSVAYVSFLHVSPSPDL